MEMFEVGGCVRDEIMGLRSDDIDFSVVLSESDFPTPGTVIEMPEPYDLMVSLLERQGIDIIRNKNTGEVIGAEHLTARGISPTRGAVDFVLARKEGTYSDGRRPDTVEPGTLMDDLKRRDFTVNAIAKGLDGELIDPFDGVADINEGLLRAVGSAQARLEEDALRAVRAIRFSVTKGFIIDPELRFAMQSEAVLDRIVNKISDDRIKKELSKMFKFDTVKSLTVLNDFKPLTRALFSGSVSLDATMKQRGRG